MQLCSSSGGGGLGGGGSSQQPDWIAKARALAEQQVQPDAYNSSSGDTYMNSEWVGGPWQPGSGSTGMQMNSKEGTAPQLGQMAQIVPVLLPQGMGSAAPGQVMTAMMPVQVAWGGNSDDNGCVWMTPMQSVPMQAAPGNNQMPLPRERRHGEPATDSHHQHLLSPILTELDEDEQLLQQTQPGAHWAISPPYHCKQMMSPVDSGYGHQQPSAHQQQQQQQVPYMQASYDEADSQVSDSFMVQQQQQPPQRGQAGFGSAEMQSLRQRPQPQHQHQQDCQSSPPLRSTVPGKQAQQSSEQQSNGQGQQAQLALSPQQLLMLLQEHQRALAEQHGAPSGRREASASARRRKNGSMKGSSRSWRAEREVWDSDEGSPTPNATPRGPYLQHFAAMTGQSPLQPSDQQAQQPSQQQPSGKQQQQSPASWAAEPSEGDAPFWNRKSGCFTGTVLHPAPQASTSKTEEQITWADYVDGPLPYYLAPPQGPDMDSKPVASMGKGGYGKGQQHGKKGSLGGKPSGPTDFPDKHLARQTRGGKGKADLGGGLHAGDKASGQLQQQVRVSAGTGEAPPDGGAYGTGMYDNRQQSANNADARRRPRGRLGGQRNDNVNGGYAGEASAGTATQATGGSNHNRTTNSDMYDESEKTIVVQPSDTMKAQLQALQEEDPSTVFIARRINKLGFTSADQLRTYFSRYGRVKGVYVSHSRVKSARPYAAGGRTGEVHWRLRAAALGFVVMASKEATSCILADGPDIMVNGVPVRVQHFNRRGTEKQGDTGASDLIAKEDREAFAQSDDMSVFANAASSFGSGCRRERWCTADEDPYFPQEAWG